MKAIILALIPIVAVGIGVAIGRWQGDSNRVEAKHYKVELNTLHTHLRRADGLIDELALMANEHQLYNDTFAVLAAEKIADYKKGIDT